jgi:hypothetical protein
MTAPARLNGNLTLALEDFLADNRDVPYKRFCLLTFLAEAMLCAESNLMQGPGFADVPALGAMLERLDEHLAYLRTDSEVRQSYARTCFDSPESRILSDEVFAWFDAPGRRATAHLPGAGL